jgi:hypothetical protein
MFNKTNAIATESSALLANTLQQYIEHQPSILSLIETWCNGKLADETIIAPQNMATSLQGNKKAWAKIATANCRNLKA